MNLLFWIILILSILCFLYYCLITAYAGFGTSFSEFWIITGLAGILLSIVIRYMIIHEIKVSKLLDILLLIIILAGVFTFFMIEGILICHSRQKSIQKVDCIIILGAQVRGTVISKTLKRRLDTAITYLKQNPETVAIVSGGKGEGEALSEAEAMRQYLVERGVAEFRILKEDKSRNTFENILYSKPLLKEKSAVAVVTNGFHIYRSIRIARKQGLREMKGLAAPTDRLLRVNYYVREAVGVLKDMVLGNL